MPAPLIVGLEGQRLSADEADFFKDIDPCGYILFARNIHDPDQVRALTDDLRTLAGRGDLPILTDQEGGRVQRLAPPHWQAHPSAARFGDIYDIAAMTALEAARWHGRAIAEELRAAGISVDCLPLLDVPAPGAHAVIGDRAFGRDPLMVASLGDALLGGLREGGIAGIVKHIPGHGRAAVDSHVELPTVDAGLAELQRDFEPFRKLAHAPMAMTAHVRYDALDADRCASLSPIVIGDIIRGDIGFGGFLMCDDLGMQALEGSFSERLTGALAAGCDAALHCSGELAEMQELAHAAPQMTVDAEARLSAAMAWPEPTPRAAPGAAARRDALLAVAA